MTKWSEMTPAQKSARSARQKRWNRANVDKTRSYCANWRKANPEKDSKRKKEWHNANPDKRREYQVARYAADPQKERARSAMWGKVNPEKRNARTGRRRARLNNAIVQLTPEEQAKVIGIYAEARALTEMIGTPYHVDHIIPISKGGLHHPSNLQVLRAVDNLRKGAKL